MNKTIISAIAGVMLSTTAMATPLTDYFFANGYTQPESITSIQAKVDSGQYYNYPYVVGGGVSKGLFSKKLTKGTAIPQIKNIAALQAALAKEQVVLVADADGGFSSALPIFVEIAKQNGVSVDELMSHLVINEMPADSDSEEAGFFSNIDTVMSNVQAAVDDAVAEIGNEITEEVAQEIAQEVAETLVEDIEAEVQSFESWLSEVNPSLVGREDHPAYGAYEGIYSNTVAK